jgi:hypothetical protein
MPDWGVTLDVRKIGCGKSSSNKEKNLPLSGSSLRDVFVDENQGVLSRVTHHLVALPSLTLGAGQSI